MISRRRVQQMEDRAVAIGADTTSHLSVPLKPGVLRRLTTARPFTIIKYMKSCRFRPGLARFATTSFSTDGYCPKRQPKVILQGIIRR